MASTPKPAAPRGRVLNDGKRSERKVIHSAFERNLSYRLSMLHHMLGRVIADVYGNEGLTTHQWKVMSVVCQFAPLPASEVQSWVTLDKSAISRAVRGLVEKGLVDRRVHGSDGRAIDLVATRTGKAVNARIVQKMSALQKKVQSVVPQADLESMFRSFDRLEHQLRAMPTGAGERSDASR